jgi:hypothetical protein
LFHGESRTLRLVRGATLPGPFGRVQWARNDKKEAQREYRQQVGGFLRAELFFFDGMNTLFRQFYGAISGKNTEPIPVSEAIRATRIMEKLFESCEPMITAASEVPLYALRAYPKNDERCILGPSIA